ncbi:MAG: glycosyltransferase family 1 protein [Candidatus Saccharimonas sp.]
MTRLKRKRIIIDGEVLVMPHFSGVGHYTLELIRALDRQLNDQKEFTASMLIHFRHIDKAKKYNFKNIEIIPSPFSLRISNGLKIHGKQPPLDLLFGKGIYLFPNFTTWPLLNSKSIPFMYDISYERYPQFAEPRNQVFLSDQVKKSARRANRIVTISESAKSEICDFYKLSTDKVGVYYPAVDTKIYYKRTTKETEDVKSKYGLVDNYILFVGNIEPRKNLKNLLLAYELLPPSIQSTYPLVLVGAKGWQDGEIFDIIARLNKQRNNVLFPSKYVTDEDLPAIYSGATAFIYPSIYEGFGIPPIEAMACELPVICANNSSLPEAVGDAALLVDAGSVTDIADAMNKLLGDKKFQNLLIKKGKRQVSKFSWDDSARKLLNDIRSMY